MMSGRNFYLIYGGTRGTDVGVTTLAAVHSAARNAQQMSEAQFRGFLEASPDAVIVVDRTGRINFASNRIEAMFGHLPSELIGKPLSVLMPERYRDFLAVIWTSL